MVEGVTSGPASPPEPTPAPVAPVADPAALAVPVVPGANLAAPVAPVAPVADPAPVSAPEAYTDFTLPEGVEMNAAALEAFAPMAKDMGLSQEQAQKLVTMDAERQVQANQAFQQEVQDTIDEWRETTKTDATIGGVNLDKSRAHTRVFLNKFASPALLELLDTTGLGNHLEFIRLCDAAGAAMGEDGVSPGGLNTPAPKTTAQLFYPNQPV